jgi:Ca2+-binding RTX toxin-like protein
LGCYGKGDIPIGGGESDFLYGRRGNDFLVGGRGADVLQGDGGKDTMVGCAGGDRFVFTALSDSGYISVDADGIVGFDGAAGDKIDRLSMGLVEFIGGWTFFDAGQNRIGARGTHSTIEMNASGSTFPEMIMLLDGLVAFSDIALKI